MKEFPSSPTTTTVAAAAIMAMHNLSKEYFNF